MENFRTPRYCLANEHQYCIVLYAPEFLTLCACCRSFARQCLVSRGLLPFLATPNSGEGLLDDAVKHAQCLGLVKPMDHVVSAWDAWEVGSHGATEGCGKAYHIKWRQACLLHPLGVPIYLRPWQVLDRSLTGAVPASRQAGVLRWAGSQDCGLADACHTNRQSIALAWSPPNPA